MHFILHDLQHGILHVDHGIFYTIGQLLYRPGHVAREFIDGKRVRHFKPVALVVILATLYGLLFNQLIIDESKSKPIGAVEDIFGAYQNVILWITKHFAYAALLLVGTTSLASYWVFKKQGYNFAVHLVLNTFFMGLVLVINLLMLPVLYVYSHSEPSTDYAFIEQSIFFLLMYICYGQFFTKITWVKTLGLTLLTFLLMSIINVAISYLVNGIIYLLK